jgi:hypothetical protein
MHRLAAAGVPNSAVEVRVATADDEPAAIEELGEVQVRGSTVMVGYWDDESATRDALASGWLRTARSHLPALSSGSLIYPVTIDSLVGRHVTSWRRLGRDPKGRSVTSAAAAVTTVEPAEPPWRGVP